MHSRLVYLAFAILIAGLGVSTASLFAEGHVAPGVLGAAVIAGVVALAARAARMRGPSGPAASAVGGPRPATVPPDGHIRFTLVVEGLDPDRIAAVWADLC